MQNFIDQVENEILKNFVAEIITKKYKCGVNQKTVASILPEHFKIEHEVMLANKFKGELKEPVQITLKIDGNRCSALIDENNNIKFLSRQGKEITGLKQIEAMLKDMRLQGYMLDGELVRINKECLSSEENFKETMSIVGSKSSNKKGLEFLVFDIVPLDDYNKRKCDLTYEERKEFLMAKINIGNQFVKLVPFLGITDSVNKIQEVLSDVEARGFEGLMLNTLSGLYKFGKRSNDLLKVKSFNTCDIYCTGVEEGTGKYAGTLGAIICDYKGYQLNVGSGFTDEQRDYYWKHKSEIVNRIVEIKYFEESSDKEGNLSLRFPVFKCVRDKDEESYE